MYIDDRLLEEYNGKVPEALDDKISRSYLAVKLTVKLLVSLGFFLGTKKCVFIPSQRMVFLGMIIDSVECSFFITEKRRQKFVAIRDLILKNEIVPLVLVQKFTGMCISMAMAIPAAKLYTPCCNRAISRAILENGKVSLDTDLRAEISHWKFIDTWSEPFPWLIDRHSVLSFSSDSSDYKWGACFTHDGKDISISDYWSDEENELSIMLKEALALKNTLASIGEGLKNKRIHAYCDNRAVVCAWENQYSASDELNEILKEIFQIIFKQKCSLSLIYVKSCQNSADGLSRALSKSDCMLSRRAWWYIEHIFGPHTVDMFSLDSNAMKDVNEKTLKHFTPSLSPESAGVDAFAQVYPKGENYYAFPPYCLIPAVIRFIIQEEINCTLLFPDIHPRPSWLTLVHRFAHNILPVGLKCDRGVILYPSKKGFLKDKVGLQWDMLAARFEFVPPLNGVCEHSVMRYQFHDGMFRPVVVLGDSMVRLLEGSTDNALVVSVGGAKVHDFTYSFLCEHIFAAHTLVWF